MRGLLATVAMVAFACFVWVAPPVVRVLALFVAVLILPGPLTVMWQRGGPGARSFALSSLAAYVAWLVVAGLPCAIGVAYRFLKGGIPDPSNIRWSIEEFVGNYYPAYVGLYAPWIIVPLAGTLGLMVHWFTQDGRSD